MEFLETLVYVSQLYCCSLRGASYLTKLINMHREELKTNQLYEKTIESIIEEDKKERETIYCITDLNIYE